MKPANSKPPYELLIFVVLCVAAGVLFALSSCQIGQPVPTPTPTRTPVLPTPTPTLTPTTTPTITPSPTLTPSPTPTPTPTVPPSLVIAAGVHTVPTTEGGSVCPTLSADLFFMREATLWVCPARGGAPEPVPVPSEAESQRIIAYQVTQEGRHVAYATEAGELYVVDRMLGQQTRIPTSGRLVDEHGTYFALTEDGTTLYYLAWGVQPLSGPDQEPPGTASLMSLDVTAPTGLQQVEALCRGGAGRACGGFALSPAEDHAVFIDARGVWSIRLERATSNVRRLQRAETVAEARQLGVLNGQSLRIHSWSPDGQWLLLDVHGGSTPSLLLLAHEAESVALNTVATSDFCEDDCVVGTSWDGNRLWVSWDAAAQGCIQATHTDELAGPVKLLYAKEPVCQVGAIPLHPRSPGSFGDAWPGTELAHDVTFLQPAVPGIWPGLYAYAVTGEFTPLVLLPEVDGTLAWAPGGNAFLYLDSQPSPAYLGDLALGALWDVRELLLGTYSFTWSEALSGGGGE